MPGTFYGYREIPVVIPRKPRLRPLGSVSPMKLSAPILERLGAPGYDYSARSGEAPEDYGTWTPLPWQCKMATWTLRGGPMEVQVSYDGSTVGDTRLIAASTMTLDAFVAFRVRQLIPGFAVWYQLLAII